MKKQKGQIQLSASDLSNFLSCHHITELDQKVVAGKLNKPEFSNPHAQVLRERGHEHEKNYLDHLKAMNLEVLEIPGHQILELVHSGLKLEPLCAGWDACRLKLESL